MAGHDGRPAMPTTGPDDSRPTTCRPGGPADRTDDRRPTTDDAGRPGGRADGMTGGGPGRAGIS